MLPEQQPTQERKKEDQGSASEEKEVEEVGQEEASCKWYLLSCLVFLAVLALYGGIFAIDRFGVAPQNSYAYWNQLHVSVYTSHNTYSNSGNMYKDATLLTAANMAMGILYSWLLWKLPLMVLLFELVSNQESKVVRFVPLGVVLVVLLAADIVLSVLLYQLYAEWMFYAGYFVLGMIVVGVGNKESPKAPLLTFVYLVLFVAFMYASYSIFLPGLYYVYEQNISEAANYLQIYLFPLFDLLFYAILLVGNKKIHHNGRIFASYLHFMQLGYFAGMTMLVGVTEVEFYYLIAYLLFRNFFVNRVMWDWETVVNNPPCLPTWGIFYVLSYMLNFIPLIGVGRIVIGQSFRSQILGRAKTLLYSIPSSLYPYDTDIPKDDFNFAMVGQIFWVAVIVIWFISTITQKYPMRKPTGYDFFYGLIGVYLFYVGICSALAIGEEGEKAFS